MSEYKKPPLDILKQKLSAEQLHVTQACGTEPPFKNKYWDNKQKEYVDAVLKKKNFYVVCGWGQYV
jgi:peptide methionine sulfoxide reductase MsrB